MASLHRPPAAVLAGLVASVWAYEARALASSTLVREHVLPTGGTHIALRIGGAPLHIFDGLDDQRGHRLGHAVVGGARTTYHVRDVSQPSISVGAMLRPGAARVLLGVPESALAGHHTPLECLLHAGEVDQLLTQLQQCSAAGERLACFERWLIGRARGRPPVLHPALVATLARPERRPPSVRDIVRASGLSHRHCVASFRHATGLTPGEWLRLRRFDHALELARSPSRGWAEIAFASGFSDQSHLTNSFRTIAGLSPSTWRRLADAATPRHVPR